MSRLTSLAKGASALFLSGKAAGVADHGWIEDRLGFARSYADALLVRSPNDHDQVSAVGEEVCSACGEATRERGRRFLAGVAATASFPPSADFVTERDLRLRAGVAWEP
jgi:hypothetical protein